MRWNSAIVALAMLGLSSQPNAHACVQIVEDGWEERAIAWADEIFVGKVLDSRRSDYSDWLELKLRGLVRRISGRAADDEMFYHAGYLIAEFERVHTVKGDEDPAIVEVWFSQQTSCDDYFNIEQGETTLVFVKQTPNWPNATIPRPEVIPFLRDDRLQELYEAGSLAAIRKPRY